ncbi:MAG TPA: hypothetical protein VMN78_10415 [Longimicrobiales bacterium]|nr:hypothetical protein [Longimicrobiales bacterium]
MALLGLVCLAGCSTAAPRADDPAIPGGSEGRADASASDVLRRAESEHWLLKLTTAEGDTVVGRVSVDADEVRVSGTSHRFDVSAVESVHRGTELENAEARRFGIMGGLIVAALVTPLAAILVGFGASHSAGLALIGSAALVGSVIGSGVGEIDQPDAPVAWTQVWPAP